MLRSTAGSRGRRGELAHRRHPPSRSPSSVADSARVVLQNYSATSLHPEAHRLECHRRCLRARPTCQLRQPSSRRPPLATTAEHRCLEERCTRGMLMLPPTTTGRGATVGIAQTTRASVRGGGTGNRCRGTSGTTTYATAGTREVKTVSVYSFFARQRQARSLEARFPGHRPRPPSGYMPASPWAAQRVKFKISGQGMPDISPRCS